MINPLVSHLISFLIGSIPMGYLLARLRGVDIRKQGSGNIGATNVARVVGKRSGIITLVADIAKGCIGAGFLALIPNHEANLAVMATHGLAAVIGHCYSPFIGFRGGKGVATSLGVFLMISPITTLIAIASFGVCFQKTKFVSLASISAALSCPIVFWLIYNRQPDTTAFLVVVMLSLLVVIRHEKNISRLIKGEEKKFSSAKNS